MTMEKQREPDTDDKLAILYEARADDPAPFECIKQYLRYPAKFRHAERTLIADLPKETSDGRDVKVFESRCAARCGSSGRYLRKRIRLRNGSDGGRGCQSLP